MRFADIVTFVIFVAENMEFTREIVGDAGTEEG
jgi:hypothetical protein